MNKRANGRRCLVLAGLLAIFSSAVQAQILRADSFALFEDQPGPGSRQQLTGPTGALSTVSYTSTIGLASGGYGEADFGALHASASAVAAGEIAETRGQGSALWIDQVTFSSATLSGAAFARVSFSLSGALSSQTNPASSGAVGNSTISAVVRANGSDVFSTGGQLVSRNGAISVDESSMVRGTALNGVFQSDPVSSLGGTFSFDIPFVFGTAFSLHANMVAFTVAATTGGADQASAFSDFGSSGYWGGLSNVHLADGTLLTDYSVSSASGFDWTSAYASPTPIPEPQTYALLLAGLGLLGFAARRKGQG